MTAPTTTSTAPSTSDLDLFADEVLADRDPFFAQLRETAAVVYLPRNEAWALTRYDVIRDALARPEVFSSTKVAWNEDMNNALRGTSLATDPPEHTPLRATLMERLKPRALRPLADDIQAKADEDASPDEVREMAKRLLIDRFKLPVHAIADREVLVLGGDDLPGREGTHDLADADGRHVGAHVVEPAAHRRVEGDEVDAHDELTRTGLGDLGGGELPGARIRSTLRPLGQTYFLRRPAHGDSCRWWDGRSPSPSHNMNPTSTIS